MCIYPVIVILIEGSVYIYIYHEYVSRIWQYMIWIYFLYNRAMNWRIYISLCQPSCFWSNENPGSDIPLWLFDGSIEGQGLCPSERVALLEHSGERRGFKRDETNARGMFGICFGGGNGGFLKSCYPTTMGFPTKNDHCGVFWGYHRLRTHPNIF